MSESTRMMLGLVIGIAIMIVLVMKTKVHTFIALLLAALITGLIGGMPVADITNAAGETTVGVMTAIKDGFGNTLKSTGIIIGLGVMIVVVFYCKYIGKKIYQIPNEGGHGYERKEFKKEYIKSMEEVEKLVGEKNLPSFTASILPIIIPIVLIFVKTFWGLFGTGEGVANTIISLVGEPIFALGVGTIIAIYGLVRKEDNKKVIGIMDTAIKDTGIIMLITGAGGSLGNVIKVSGIGNVLGETVVGLPLPAILIPFIIAALMRIALGSATVAITTAASLTAPLMAAISVSPILLAASCCVGAISFSYFNDSGFWVFNGMFGLTELKDQVRCKTAVSLIMAGVGIIELLLLQFVL